MSERSSGEERVGKRCRTPHDVDEIMRESRLAKIEASPPKKGRGPCVHRVPKRHSRSVALANARRRTAHTH